MGRNAASLVCEGGFGNKVIENHAGELPAQE